MLLLRRSEAKWRAANPSGPLYWLTHIFSLDVSFTSYPIKFNGWVADFWVKISLSPVQQFAWALFRLARFALILRMAPFLDPRFVTNNSLIRFFWNRVSPQHSVWLKPWFMLKSRWMADMSERMRCAGPFPCRCSFSIKNPLQSKGFRSLNGEGGIRTLDRVAPIQHFQCCAFDHSATSPVAEVRM